LTRENRDTRRAENLPSPNYVYTLARQRRNLPVCHRGATLVDTVEVLKQGALSLAQHPYQADDCEAPPPPEKIQTADDFKVRGMRLLNVKRIDDVKGVLTQSNPVIIEFHSSLSFKQHRGDAVYQDPDPEYVPSDLWHAMTLVGYDEKRQAFRLINSWGRGWGDGGYAWIGYDVFASRVRRAAILDVDVPPQVAQLQLTRPAPNLTKIESARPTPAPSPPGPIPGPIPDENRPSILSKPIEPTPSPAQQRSEPVALPKPELPQPAAPSVRLKAELADSQGLACARVTVAKRGERNMLRGFVGSEAEAQLVTRIAADVPKTGLGEITVAPWPQCEALQTLDKALTAADSPKIDIGARDELREGEPLQIVIRSPRRIGYLYVTYVQSDGSAINLVQPQGIVPEPTLPGRTLAFGNGREGRATFTITPPFGREMIIALNSAVPLFASPLPHRQTDREYLTELRRALITKVASNGAGISASIKTLQTRGR
jgi:hypothetical protein